jgi:hypothetical protein
MSETITPNSMPGAQPAEAAKEPAKAEPTKAAEAKPPKPETPAAQGLSADERAELERLRAVHKDERKHENRAKVNKDAAPKMRALAELLGIEPDQYGVLPDEFDPQAEFQKLRTEVDKERTERLRSEVARTEGVDLEDVHGNSEDEMRESAKRYKAKVEAAIEAALKGRATAAVPASEVTSNGKVAGPTQIKSQDELKNMSPKEIMAADAEGRLDFLKGKT